MILPFEAAVAWAAAGVPLAVLGWWLLEEGSAAAERASAFRGRRFWRCQICAAFYTAEPEERLTICPQCASYNS